MGSYKTVTEKMTVRDALDNYSDIAELKSELEQWKEGMDGTGLENTEKYQTLSDSIDALEKGDDIETAAGNIELPEELESQEITFTYMRPYGKDPMTRAQRLSYCCASISAAVDAIRDYEPEEPEPIHEEDEPETDEETGMEDSHQEDEEPEPWDVPSEVDDIQSALDELENVEFPGMYR